MRNMLALSIKFRSAYKYVMLVRFPTDAERGPVK